MSKEIKFTPEELKEVSAIKESFNQLTFKFGEIQMELQNLEIENQKLIEDLKSLRTNETSVIEKLTAKYGNGTLHPESGVFIPQ